MLVSLLAKGDPAFLLQLDLTGDPGFLRKLARWWYAQREGGPRELLLSYLQRPLHPLHEPLVVRLVRLAARAGDDPVMARLLVLLDRSLRRYSVAGERRWRLRCPERVRRQGDLLKIRLPDRELVLRSSGDHEIYRLLAVSTRLILRKRIWRYFNRLGREQPARYVQAATEALLFYTDADVVRRVGFLDNWGLLNLLYRHAKELRRCKSGWWWQPPYHDLLDLDARPAHAMAWFDHPEALARLAKAPCWLVRLWAARMLGRSPDFRAFEPDVLLAYLESEYQHLRQMGRRLLVWSKVLDQPLSLWRRLVLSPHPDVRGWFLGQLDERQRGWPFVLSDALPLTEEHLKVLWARVFLTVHGRWRRSCRTLVKMLLARLSWQPGEDVHLVPMLGEVLRHTEGLVREETLAGLVRSLEGAPGRAALAEREIPGLLLEASGAV